MKRTLFSIIVPTLNRPKSLKKLISKININDNKLLEIIIVDSSDLRNSDGYLQNSKIKYIHTNEKSAAVQRNIGIQHLAVESERTFFLDDDVLINQNYFDLLNQTLDNYNAIGTSGVAINLKEKNKRQAPSGFTGLVKRIFLLDSKIDGKLLRSAVNVPCRIDKSSNEFVIEVDWLIGCALWDNEIFRKIKFESTFFGQSLGEDLLFSHLAKKYGKIFVNKSVILNHEESTIERPNSCNFYKMWIVNRYFISRALKLSTFNISFHWANFGKFISLLVDRHQDRTNSLRGLIYGYSTIWRKNK